MPTTSQWKILHSLLRAGRLKQPDSASDEGKENAENNGENKERQTDLSKQVPERRNSFHFLKNSQGILTILCRPKSVPVKFSTKRETDSNSNELSRDSSDNQILGQAFPGVNLDDITLKDNKLLIEGSLNSKNDVLISGKSNITKSNYDAINDENNSATYPSQAFKTIPENDDDYVTPKFWDGVSAFPELLDPTGMKSRNTSAFQSLSCSSALKQWRSASPTKTNKSVTFRNASGDTTTCDKQDTDENDDAFENIDDEDNMDINFDNVDKILPKFNDPLGVLSCNDNRNSSFPCSATPSSQSVSTKLRTLRPLKSAPALRGISKSLSVFTNNKNNSQQRSKTSLGPYTTSTTSEIDPGIPNDFTNIATTSSRSSSGGSGVFRIRHTTFAYKESPSLLVRPKSSQSLPSATGSSSSSSPSSSKPKLNCDESTKQRGNIKCGDSESFEPFVIQNGRLVRRASMSNGMFASSNHSNTQGMVRKGSAKFSILGKDEGTTLSRICDAFIVRGGSGLSHRGAQDHTNPTPNGLQRPLSGPWPTKAVSRWSMATQSIITRSVSTGNLAAVSSASPRGSGFDESRATIPDAQEIELPEEVQENLQKLGFRKQKGKKKKEKSEKSKRAQAKKQEMKLKEESTKSAGIDLTQDPMLVKVQKKNRNVGTFACEPESQPFAVCFEVKGSAPSHADVMTEINKLIKPHPEVSITKLQFDYRALVNNSPEMENRWIVTTNSVTSRNRMAGSHIRLHGHESQLRRYDDVITTEYQQYKRMMDFVKMMNSRLGMK